MAKQDFMRFLGPNLPNGLSSMNNFGFDFTVLFETQRKNLEALTEAHQTAFEGFQALVQRQRELLTSIMRDHSNMASEIMGESTPEQKVARQADLMKRNYENSVKSLRELSDMLNKSGIQASEILNKRVSASLSEIKTVLEKNGKASAVARQKAA